MKASLVLALLGSAQAVLPVVQYGNKFYQVNEDATKPGTEFTIVGVDYQPGGSSSFDVNGEHDVLSDGETCLRDVYALQQLGVNTIRVYSVSPWLNHDECMSLLNDAGIYVILDVNNPYQSLHRTNPGDSYNKGYLNNVFGLLDAFKYYPNTLGFVSGNEIVNEQSDDDVPLYLRAVQRDIKQYLNNHANRTIPVGYSAASVAAYRYNLLNYLQCGNDTSSTSDFYGLNSYEWCSGTNDWESSGYETFKDNFANSSIPIFFSEYGCNKNQPRTFDEVYDGLYAADGLASEFSGGLVYEYSEESSNYGLVDIQDDGSIKYKEDFDNLKSAYGKITLNDTTQPSSAAQPPSCQGLDTIIDNFDLPDCPADDLLENGVGQQNIGHIIPISNITAKYAIYGSDGTQQDGNVNFNATTNWQTNIPTSGSASVSFASTTSSAASSSSSSLAASTTSANSTSSTSKKNAGPAAQPVAPLLGLAGAIFALL